MLVLLGDVASPAGSRPSHMLFVCLFFWCGEDPFSRRHSLEVTAKSTYVVISFHERVHSPDLKFFPSRRSVSLILCPWGLQERLAQRGELVRVFDPMDE